MLLSYNTFSFVFCVKNEDINVNNNRILYHLPLQKINKIIYNIEDLLLLLKNKNDNENNNNNKNNGIQIASILKNKYNTKYIGSIEIGTLPRKFHTLFDTGSANVVVFSSECVLTCSNNTKYNREESNTWRRNDTFAHIQYGSADVIGFFSKR